MKRLFYLLLILLLPLFARAEGLTLTAPDTLRPYVTQKITVTAPMSGEMTLRIGDGLFEYVIAQQLVEAGETTISWNGLHFNDEAVCRGTYTLSASLTSGQDVLTAQRSLRILPSAAALQYCIPSAYTVHAGHDGFVVNYLLTAEALMHAQLYRADDPDTPIKTWGIEQSDMLPHMFKWNGQINNRNVAEGAYILTFKVKNSEQEAYRFEITVTHDAPEKLALGVSTPELFLPEDITDPDKVWQAMMTPVAVVDIGDVAHQNVYAQPSDKSLVAGKVHGQTQGLMVLEINVNGYARVRAWREADGEYIEGYIPQNKLKVIRPDDRYGVLIDKRDQTLTVYENGQIIGSIGVSTGLMDKDNLWQETRAGAFLTQDRIINFTSEGYGYNYAIRIDGGNLIHSMGYKRYDGQKWDYSEHLAQIGEKASHGCVRTDTRATESGINIYWLWTHLPIHTKVLVIDDPQARAQRLTEICGTPTPSPQPALSPEPTAVPAATPVPTGTPAPAYEGLISYKSHGLRVTQLQEKLKELGYYSAEIDGVFGDATRRAVVAFQKRNQLQADGVVGEMTFAALFGDDAMAQVTAAPTHAPAATQAPAETAPPTATPSPTPVPPDDVMLTLTFGGDTLLGSEDAVRKRENSFDSVIDAQGYAYPLQNLLSLFAADDLTTLNLECIFKNDSANKAEGRMFNFRGPTDHVNILTAASVEHVNLANNHYVDYGYAGRRTTRETLSAAGVAYSGYGETWIFEKDGVKIGFSGIRETIWHQDRSVPAQEIKALRDAGCDYIIYSCHFGTEYDARHNDMQELIAHTVIDAGADCVIGHHPHVVQGIEVYNGKPIFYSLGNLVFGGNLTPKDYDGMMVQLQISFHKKEVTQVSAALIPVMTSGVQDGTTNFQPVIAEGEDKTRILERVQADSEITINESIKF